MKKITREEAQKEVDGNYRVFKENIDDIIKKYPNKKFILLINKNS